MNKETGTAAILYLSLSFIDFGVAFYCHYVRDGQDAIYWLLSAIFMAQLAKK